MAKKGKGGFDDLDLDNMDWDDFDEPPRAKDKKRKPVLDTLNTARKSALATVWPKGKRDQVIMKGMPKPAADAYDGYQNAAAATKDVLAHTKEELQKTNRVLKQQARQLGPTMRRYLPDKLTRKIDRWAKNDDVQYANYDPRQAQMDRELGSVMGDQGDYRQQVRDQADERDAAVEDRLRESIRDMKSDAMFGVMTSMAKDIQMQTSLAKGVMLNISRKQLELQYRMLFALEDANKLNQAQFDRNTPALEAIVKNTALPDYAKEDFSEIHYARIKRQLADWTNPLKYADGFIDKIKDNTKKKISEGMGDVRGMLEMVLGTAVEDDFDLDDSSTLTADKRRQNGTQKATGWLASQAAKRLLGPQVEKLQKATREKLEQNPEFMRLAQRGKYGFGNLSSISNSAIAGEDMGPLGGLFKALNMLGIIDPLQREKGMLDERNPTMLDRAAKFDHRSWLTLNEVLPAWLGEINKSIRRGYGEHADMTYDITSRGFVDRKVIGNRVRKAVANDDERKRLQGSVNSTVDYLDHNKTLNQKERQQLADFIEERASTGKAFNVDALKRDPQALQRFMGFHGSEKIQELLGSHPGQGVGGGYELSNELANRMAIIQSSISRRQGRIDEATGIYGERALRDAGIFHYDDKNDVFHVDRDLSDPHTLFNDLAMGKTKSGRSLTREQEIIRKLKNGSATSDYLRRLGLGDGSGKPDEQRRGGGFGGGLRGGITALQMSNVLYGDKPTTFPELFETLGNRLGGGGGTGGANDDLIQAIRGNNYNDVLSKILDHVRDMNEEGVFILNSLRADGDDLHGPSPGPGGGGGPGGSGGGGLLRRWGRLGLDSAGAGWRAGRRGLSNARARGGKIVSWLRGRFGGPSSGPGIGSRLLGGVGNIFSSAKSFAKGLLGAKDVYNAQGKVVLNGKRLAAGDYYQQGKGQAATLTQLFKLDDIRMGRDIVDIEGNVILSATDLAQGGDLSFYTGSTWRKLSDAIGAKAGELGRGILGAPGRLASKLGNPLRTVRNWFTNQPDVYVKGETNPRLFANRMRDGEYRLKEGGRVIYKASEVTGAVVDQHGNDVITAAEMANPDFKLVDRWGRDVKSPLGRIGGRIGRLARGAFDLAGKIPGMLRGGVERFTGMIKDNPLTRWWGNRGSSGDRKWFSGNSFFGGFGGSAKKTNHILIRIYKLLNQRLAGDHEDDSWTSSMEDEGRAGGGGIRGVRNSLSRAWRRGKVMSRRRWGKRFDSARGRVSGWWNRGRQSLGDMLRRGHGAATDIADRYTGAEHDIGMRYLVEQRLAGRDDESANFYRDRLYRRKGLNGARLKSDLSDAAEETKDAAGRVINTGKKKVKTVGQAMLDKLNQMVGLQEITWFDKMRTSTLAAGGTEGFVRGMMNKFSRRNKFGDSTEKKDYFNFFRRQQSHRGEDGHPTGGAAGGQKRGGVMGLVDKLTNVVAGIGSVLGGLGKGLAFLGKWGVFKPAQLMARGAWAVATRALPWAVRAIASPLIAGASAVVTAVGWPVIAVVAGVVAVSYAAYKIATNVPAKYLDKMRLAQYGFRDYEKWNGDDGAKAMYLEDQLKGYISYNNGGDATLRGLSAADVEKLAEGFGVNKEEKSELISFHAFMLQRFIPIYLRWMTSIRGLETDVALKDLGDITKVSKADMQTLYGKNVLTKDSKYLKAIEDPRKVGQGFFSKLWDTVTFTSPDLLEADDVLDVQAEVEKSIKFRAEGPAAARNHLAPPTSEGVKVSGVAESVNRLAALDKDRQDNTIKKEGWEDGNEQVTIQVDYNSVIQQKDVDALQSLRVKAYGLVTLNPAQVKSLLLMERIVYPNIDVKNATFKGKWQEAIDALVPGGSTSEKADRLKYWFFNRFLPVFMTYVTGVYRYSPTSNPLDLKLSGGYLYEVGLMTSRAYSMKNDIRQSIWDIAINPFGGDANTLATSVNAELETLHVLSKEADLAVRNLMRENEKKQGRAQWKQKELSKGLYGGNAANDDPNINSYGVGSAERARGDAINGSDGYSNGGGGWNGSQEIASAGGIANYAAMTTGSSKVSLGAMGDGNYKELAEKYPRAQLNNVSNVKAMIVDVAQKLGVPPGVALGMAYAESKFNYKAWNQDSGAGGLFQFIKSTWSGRGNAAGEMQNYGNKFGIPAGSTQLDPYANVLLGVNFIRNNIKQAEKDYGGQVPPGVAYLYHFLGAGDAAKFMRAYKANPGAPANSIRYASAGVIKNNMSVFTSGGRIRSFAEVMQELNGRMGSQVANIATSNPELAKKAMGGQTPVASEPAVAAGAPAANDANGAEQRKDTALAQKGAQAANDASTQAASVTAPNPAGISTANSPSDVSTAADNAAAQAEADGMSPSDAQKVKAGYENQAAARATPRKPAGDMPASASDPVTGTSMAELIGIEKESRDFLEKMYNLMQKGGSLAAAPAAPAATAPGAAQRKQSSSAPASTLSLDRKAS
ncbi:hypothetical protein pEaSNUABM11_00270 [Erwinia phage pEa_SNUABM_11]|nr:hypothetical protein pEaSNUABM11_00270 [Erwinia phage pEa_SNUABM_11]